jgi:monovalent cation:H+ antiporter, CPA1 family
MTTCAMPELPAEHLVDQLAWLLLGATLMGMLARWVRIPYAVVLVLCGLAVEASHLVPAPQLEPGVVLFVFLPPLLFDASFRFDTDQLRSVVRPILLLAVPGTLASALVVGGLVAAALQLPLSVALLFGSLIAATDPVAVVAVFQRLGVPGRLSAIADGESLVNDGIAVTLYTAFLGVALGSSPSVIETVGVFAREVVGGVAIGLALGFVASRLGALVDDHLIEMTLSTALAYGSYLVASSLDTSGPLAVVAAGLLHGSYGRHIGMSESTNRLLDDLWEYLGFVANSLVFLGVGLTVDIASFVSQPGPVVVAIAAVLASRALVVGAYGLLVRKRRDALTRPEQAVLTWGGLRGALSMALALALPAATPERGLITLMTFGVVLFTLVVQGLTLPVVVTRAGLATSAD